MNRLGEQTLILLAGITVAIATCMSAQAEPSTEYDVKAAFIHNIAKYVEWPAAPGALRLCVAGRNPFGGALDVLRGKQVGKLMWEIEPVNAAASLKHCRVLFIAASEDGNLGQILANVKGNAVLTVGDSDGYAERGVMVNFYLEGKRVRFEINNDAARRAGLKFGSQLLKLARIVQDAVEVK